VQGSEGQGGETPDLVEEILGWKVLALADDGALSHVVEHPHNVFIPTGLASPLRDVRWPEQEWLYAACPDASGDHRPPDEACTCGIYAVAQPSAARAYIWKARLTVLARVALAGKVIPGANGWRGERARVAALTRTGAGPHDYPHMLAHVARRYDVPIIDIDLLGPRNVVEHAARGDR
jgi:hypothetical protein